MTKRIDDLVQNVLGGADHPLAPFLRSQCHESRLFLTFAETYATKIRKKARLAPLADELADLFAELAVAAFLVRDRRSTVRYEPYRATGQRGPDFQVAFKGHSPLHVDVTRLRLLAYDDPPRAAFKLARVVCDKIGQFPPGAMNLLAVVVPPGAESDALAPAALRLLDREPRREGSLPSPELPPEGVRAYCRQRQRLSAVALCSFGPDGRPLSVRLWPNPQAKHPLPPDVIKYLADTAH
ncbi:hypothetical protein [Deinococcus aluminii]|uniref:Uncharacterized protein n=1 Tax=Deinococcus aluminii TaxID=1656885 RepID=A0ABP9XAR7_9DEIO